MELCPDMKFFIDTSGKKWWNNNNNNKIITPVPSAANVHIIWKKVSDFIYFKDHFCLFNKTSKLRGT